MTLKDIMELEKELKDWFSELSVKDKMRIYRDFGNEDIEKLLVGVINKGVK